MVDDDSSGERSGCFVSLMGVGTAMMMNVQARRAFGLAVKERLRFFSSAGSTSPVWSRPDFSSSTRAFLMSNPTTWKRFANATASGRPT